jgi:hypothetical protein
MSISPGQRGLWPQLDYIDRAEVQSRLGPHNPLLWRVAHEPQMGLWVAPPTHPDDRPKPGFEVFPNEDAEEAGDES